MADLTIGCKEELDSEDALLFSLYGHIQPNKSWSSVDADMFKTETDKFRNKIIPAKQLPIVHNPEKVGRRADDLSRQMQFFT